jgi:hypothetical protein
MSVKSEKAGKGMSRSIVLLILGVAYLGIVASTFVFHMDLASDKTMQVILHVTVILSAFAYLLFVDAIYSAEKDEANGRLALLFAALFTLPVAVARGIGLLAISNDTLFSPTGILNFYASVSVIRTVEIVGWTTFFPMSMLFLAKLFFRKYHKNCGIAWLCLLSAACCFVAFLTIVSPNTVILYIGIAGWGVLFLLVVLAYLIRQVKRMKEKHTR